MVGEPISEKIRTSVWIYFACLRRGRLRDFTGYAVGKRRNLSCVQCMSSEMATNFLLSLEFNLGGHSVQADQIASVVAEVLLSVSPEDAFELSKRYEHHAVLAMRNSIGGKVAKALMAAFGVAKRPPRVSIWFHNMRPADGMTWGDEASASMKRYGDLRPRYPWRRAGGLYDEDFVAFDGGVKFGRIWLDERMGPSERWQWSCLVTMTRILNSPSRGGADLARQAARDLEDHYDALKRLNGMEE